MISLKFVHQTLSLRSVNPCFISKCFLSTSSVLHSRYPKYYVYPVYKDEQLEELKESGEADKLAFVPVRSAEPKQNNSVWHDPVVNKFISMLMEGGKKAIARQQFEKCFRQIKRKQLDNWYAAETEDKKKAVVLDPWAVFHEAVKNCSPLLETIPVIRGGTTYRVPVPVRHNKGQFMAMKWLIAAARDRDIDKTRFIYHQLADDLLEASQNQGRTVKKKQDLHKLCEANRAFAHFRWQ